MTLVRGTGIPFIIHTQRQVDVSEMTHVRAALTAAERDGVPLALSGWDVTTLGPTVGEYVTFLRKFHDDCDSAAMLHGDFCWNADPTDCELVAYVRKLESGR